MSVLRQVLKVLGWAKGAPATTVALLILFGVDPNGALSSLLDSWLPYITWALALTAVAIPLSVWHVRGLAHMNAQRLQLQREAADELHETRSQLEAAQRDAAKARAGEDKARLEATKLQADLASTQDQLAQALEEVDRLRGERTHGAGTDPKDSANLEELKRVYDWHTRHRLGIASTLADARAQVMVTNLIGRGVLTEVDLGEYQMDSFGKRVAALIASEEARLGFPPP